MQGLVHDTEIVQRPQLTGFFARIDYAR